MNNFQVHGLIIVFLCIKMGQRKSMYQEYKDAPGMRTFFFSLAASSACKGKATLHGYDSLELFEY